MKLFSKLPSRTGLALACGLFLSAGVFTSHARADQWDKKTILTVKDQPIQIRETVLEPGQYVLRLLDSQSDRHVVQIFNSDQTHIINTVLAIPANRLEPRGHTTFSFWETPPGTLKAMRRWYYPGDSFGQEFPYPKHLQQVAMLMTPAAPAAAAVEAEPTPTPEPAPQEAQPQPEAAAPAPAPEEQQPAEIAQNTTPAPATPEPQSTPSQPKELPKTGTYYPLIGLGGALFLGLFVLLRQKRFV